MNNCPKTSAAPASHPPRRARRRRARGLIPLRARRRRWAPVHSLDLKQYLANLERDFIERALKDSGGVVKNAAERLRLRRTTLIEKMRRHGLGSTRRRRQES